MISRKCGALSPPNVTSTHNYLYLDFHTQDSVFPGMKQECKVLHYLFSIQWVMIEYIASNHFKYYSLKEAEIGIFHGLPLSLNVDPL